MKKFVLDASVAAKWFLPADSEPYSQEAMGILEQYTAGRLQLLVPDLFWPELANLLWKAVRQGRIAAASTDEAVVELSRCKMPTTPSASLLADAISIAGVFRRPVYDSMYIALAINSSCRMLTADEKLVNAVGAHLPVQWLPLA